MDLLKPRKIFAFDRWDSFVLAAYTALLAWSIAHHERWFDESQAWVIARDCSLWDMLTRRLRYEGATPLWHLILWVLTRLHVPFMAMNWVCALFPIGGVALFLRYAPFPRLFRVLIPFTFFFAYQYAVIARSYMLFPLLVFLLCILYLDERPRVLRVALVCGLLANLNVHGLLFSGAFLLLYAWKVYRPSSSFPVPSRRSGVYGLAVYASLALVAVLVVLPPPDVNFAITRQIKKHKMSLLAKIIPPEKLPMGVPKLDELLPVSAVKAPPMNRFEKVIWDRTQGAVGTPLQQALIGKLIGCISLLDYPISSSNFIALAFFFSLGFWLWSRRALEFLFPYFVLLMFEVVVWTWVHQTGLLVISLIAAAWIGSSRPQVRGRRWMTPLFAVTSILVILTQIGWTLYSVRYDTTSLYDPGRVTHDFLLSHYPGKRIAAFTIFTDSIQPYSSESFLINQKNSYWIWSSQVNVDQRRTEVLAMHPDIILTGDEDYGNEVILNQWMTLLPPNEHLTEPMLNYWESHGYRETHRFCGARPIRFGFANTFCDVILEANPSI